MSLLMIITINSKLYFKKIVVFNVESTWVAFKSVIISGLDQEFSLLTKRTRMEKKKKTLVEYETAHGVLR